MFRPCIYSCVCIIIIIHTAYILSGASVKACMAVLLSSYRGVTTALRALRQEGTPQGRAPEKLTNYHV